MSDTYIGRQIRILFKIGVVKPPVVGKIGAHEDYVTGFEAAHVVADELSPLASLEMYQFNLRMKMPAIVDIRDEIPPYAERVPGLPGNFKQLRSHIKRFSVSCYRTLVKMEKIVFTLTTAWVLYLRKRLHEVELQRFRSMELNYNVFVNKIEAAPKFD